MRPLLEKELSELTRLHQEDKFQSTRRNEIREFWQSGYDMAELQMSGKVKIDTEIRNYKKAARQLSYELKIDPIKNISFHIRQGKVIVVRKD